MADQDTNPDSLPMTDDNPDSAPDEVASRADPRSDIEQVVEARADAVARGEGGEEPSPMTDTSVPDGVGGTGGEVKNQDLAAQ